MKVSIIVPVFNVEKYLDSCIYSLLNQSYKDIEIILIDDGSCDKSGVICDKYSTTYPNVITKHISNAGVSNARNVGIKLAKGDYLQFVDSDDLLPENCTESLVRAIENMQTDMVICGYSVIENGKTISEITPKKQVIDIKDTNEIIELVGMSNLINSPWNKLYKRERIKEYFLTDIKLGEDLIFNFNYIEQCRKIGCINKNLYFYMKNNSSLTMTYRKDMIKDIVTIDKFRKAFFQNYKKLNRINTIFASDIHNLLCLITKDKKLNKNEKKREFYSILESPYVIKELIKIDTKELNDKKLLALLSLKKNNLKLILWMLYYGNANLKKEIVGFENENQ